MAFIAWRHILLQLLSVHGEGMLRHEGSVLCSEQRRSGGCTLGSSQAAKMCAVKNAKICAVKNAPDVRRLSAFGASGQC